VIDTQVAANRYGERNYYYKQHEYTPGMVGLPAYLDEFCATAGDCKLPIVSFGNNSYQGISNATGSGLDVTNIQGQTNLTAVFGNHTLRSGIDVRQARRYNPPAGNGHNPSGTYLFDNTYTRAADTTVDFASNFLGPSMAALMLGIPTQVSVSVEEDSHLSNNYRAGFFQDNWRATQNLTVNLGLRYEYEDGIKEENGEMLVDFDPNAANAITQLAEAAYARNPIPQVPVSAFRARGAAVYASGPDARTWKGQSMWEPRLGATYKVGEKTVVKAGYGLYYDTLNATASNILNTGYSVTTTNVASTDFGQTWLLGDPRNGVSPLSNPFPVRFNGSRFETALGDSLGGNILLGSSYTVNNVNREHPRVQRWRASVQRELAASTSIEVAYSGVLGDRLEMNIEQSYVPEGFYASGNARDTAQQTLLQGNVANPFHISNFESLRTTSPELYQRLAGNSFFTSTTIQRQFLIRAFPEYGNANGIVSASLPLGRNKTHALEVNVQRRYASGLAGSVSYMFTHSEDLTRVETYERVPTLWQSSNSARPHRISASGMADLPFGRSRAFLDGGGVLAAIVGDWQLSGTFEYQPGQLLQWSGNAIGSSNNIFFYGDLDDIAVDNPTLDRWFNIDAGFERDPNKVPANFQKRAFPFRVEGVRSYNLLNTNMSLLRNIRFGGSRVISIRVNAQNLFNRQGWNAPNLNPASTQFGMITTPSGMAMRFITFVTKFSF
jgi:hypothetical protein